MQLSQCFILADMKIWTTTGNCISRLELMCMFMTYHVCRCYQLVSTTASHGQLNNISFKSCTLLYKNNHMYLSDSIQIQWIIVYILMGMFPSFTCTHSTYWYNLLFKTGQYLKPVLTDYTQMISGRHVMTWTYFKPLLQS